MKNIFIEKMLFHYKAGKLAMETLLGLTSRRSGEWFKEELRRLKGIDFILDTVIRCAENYNDEGFMIKIDRCMHVLENVSRQKFFHILSQSPACQVWVNSSLKIIKFDNIYV